MMHNIKRKILIITMKQELINYIKRFLIIFFFGLFIVFVVIIQLLDKYFYSEHI